MARKLTLHNYQNDIMSFCVYLFDTFGTNLIELEEKLQFCLVDLGRMSCVFDTISVNHFTKRFFLG